MSITAQLFGTSAAPSADGLLKVKTGGEAEGAAKGLSFSSAVKTDELFKKVPAATTAEAAAAAAAARGAAAEAKRKKHLSHARDEVDPDEVRRTVFVCNLPNAVDSKDVKKHFGTCGPIESVRVRCIHLKDLQGEKDRGRAVRILRKEIDTDPRWSSTAYIVFERASSVDAALDLSGSVLKGHHLSVGREEADGKAFLPKFSVFLGNLAYDVSDEEVWQYFLERSISDVDRVRVIRDKVTGAAKGIGYVSFRSSASVQRAIDVREQLLRGRSLRIAHVQKPKDTRFTVDTATRREKRRLLHQKATNATAPEREAAAGKKLDKKTKAVEARGGEHKTSGRREEGKAVGIDEMPSWMGTTTNPRKKLPAELRVLTHSVVELKKRAKDKRKDEQARLRDARKTAGKKKKQGKEE